MFLSATVNVVASGRYCTTAIPFFWLLSTIARTLRSSAIATSVIVLPLTCTRPVPVSMKPSEHLVNLYSPVALFHWKRLPVLLSFKRVSKDEVTVAEVLELLLDWLGSVGPVSLHLLQTLRHVFEAHEIGTVAEAQLEDKRASRKRVIVGKVARIVRQSRIVEFPAELLPPFL